MGTDYAEGFVDDGEGPVHRVTLTPFAIDRHPVTNSRFRKFVEETGYRTEAEHFGWSFVFWAHLPQGRRDELIQDTVAAAPWWCKVAGARWDHPEGPGSGVQRRVDHPVVHVSNTWEYAGNYTLILGRHTMKLGGSLASNNYQLDDVEAQETTGTFQTSNLEYPTSSTGASTGDALASFLLGVPSAAGFRNTVETEHGGAVNSAYVQDQFQVNSHLAVNMGLRWDVSVWPVLSDLSNGAGYVGDMNLNNGTYIIRAVPPACSQTVAAPCIPGGVLPANVVVSNNKSGSLHNADFSNWQGRLGLAYHPLDKLSITAAYSRFYDNWNGVTQLAQDVGGTWPSVGILTAATLNTSVPQALIGDPLLQGNGSVVTPAATPFNNNGTFYNPNLKTPSVDQWNLGVAQGFGTNTVLSLTYSGSHSSRLDIHALNNTAEYAAPGTAAQVASRRKYPYIVPITYDNSTGNSNYNALQTTLKRTTSNGLTYLVSYTWSKSIDLACSGIYGGCLLQDPYNPRADRSVSGFDLTNMLSTSVVYQLPFGRTRGVFSGTSIADRLANGALGGWSVNGIASYTSGTPYSVTVSGDIANTGNTAVQANLVGNPNPAHRTASEWINPAAFVSPPRYTFGTFGRNALRSDPYKNLDLSVFKNFALPREASLQFRAEAFNATNSVVFAAPSSLVGSTTFGSVGSTANTPRELQLALKVLF